MDKVVRELMHCVRLQKQEESSTEVAVIKWRIMFAWPVK